MSISPVQRIKEGIITRYKKEYPEEKVYSKAFSLYLLNKYARLLYKIYQQAGKDK